MSSTLHIVRISGLPGCIVDPFLSEPAWQAVTAWHQSAEEFQTLRGSLVDALFIAVHGAEPRLRRLLLDLKRACFNGRPLEALTRRLEWPQMPSDLRGQAETLIRYERHLELASQALHQIYESETARSVASLSPHLSDRRLLRGISIASSSLIEELHRQAQEGPTKRGRKVRKAERSLLRYLTRAALKVSPYSTLTGIGVAALTGGDASPRRGLRVFGPPWEERSLVRARRFLVDQLLIFLADQAPVRRHLRVALNSSIERLDDAVFRLLKPVDLLYDESEHALRLTPPTQLKVRLSGPLIEHLLAYSWDEPPRLATLLSDLGARCATDDEAAEDLEESVASTVDQLIRVGFLALRSPWSAYETRIEESLETFLLALDLPETLQPIAAALSKLVAAEDGFAHAPEPVASLSVMTAALNDAWRHLVAVNDLRLTETAPFARPPVVYEDVFLAANDTGDGNGEYGAAFRMPRAMADELLRCGNAIATIFNLFNPRYNFLLSLAGLLRQQTCRTGAVGFLDLFAAAQPLWRDYVGSRRRHESLTFNPNSEPQIDHLRALRREVRDELDRLRDHCVNPPATAFEAVAAQIPRRYHSLVGCCLFVQPADAEGRLWVMNRLLEGTGRFSCRFTAAMPEALRKNFTDRFTVASRLEVNGRPIELLDILYGRENTVNQHWPQTPKVLEIPGEWSDLPAERRLTLSDLAVHLDEDTALPILRDRAGVQYLPCQMNAIAGAYMPVLLKFLAMFGPLTARPEIFPSWAATKVDGVTLLDRLTFDNLVFRRKRWVVPARLLPDRSSAPVVYFRELGRRLQRLGIPRQVFWLELVQSRPGEEGDAKPQFLDFSSPLLVGAFQDSNVTAPAATFEEVLPARTAFPLGADERRWGVEVILESLLMTRPA